MVEGATIVASVSLLSIPGTRVSAGRCRLCEERGLEEVCSEVAVVNPAMIPDARSMALINIHVFFILDSPDFLIRSLTLARSTQDKRNASDDPGYGRPEILHNFGRIWLYQLTRKY